MSTLRTVTAAAILARVIACDGFTACNSSEAL